MKKYLKRFLDLGILVLIISIAFVVQSSKLKPEYIASSTTEIQDIKITESIARGKEVYADFCMQCHLPDGKGTSKIYPPLAGSDWLINKRKESIYSIKYGLNGPIKVNGMPYNNAMTSLGLEDEEIADVMNYIMNSWGNTQKKMVTVAEVKLIQKQK